MNMSQNMEFVHVLGIQSTVPEKKEIKTVKQAKIKNLLLKIKELQDCWALHFKYWTAPDLQFLNVNTR